MEELPASVEARFWSKVDQDGPLPSVDPSLGPCWIWTAGKSHGYGIFRATTTGTPIRAHQMSWRLHDLGPIPKGLVIRHRCGVRACLNPAHLTLGTRAQNNQDTHDHGRWYWVAPGQGERRRKRPPQRRGPKPKPIGERFWPKVNKDGPIPEHDPTLGPCWLWTGGLSRQRYGRFFVPGKKRDTAQAKAHRFSYALANGPIPEGLDVLHHCDIRHCVNPAHLYLGTDKENSRDAWERHRFPTRKGESNANAKLTDAQVAEIRARYAAGGVTQQRLADEFGVAQAHISTLVRGRQRS